MGFPYEVEIVTASGRVTVLSILSLCNEKNDITNMFLKKLWKKADRYSNNDALKIAIFLIQREITGEIEEFKPSHVKPEYKILGILSVFWNSCIMDLSAQYKSYSCACTAMTCIPINSCGILPGNSYVEKYGLTIFCAFCSLASPQTYMSHN